MAFLSKIKGLFGGNKEEDKEDKLKTHGDVMEALAQTKSEASYKERAVEAKKIMDEGREAIHATLAKTEPVKLVPKAEQEKQALVEMVTAYLDSPDMPFERVMQEVTGVENVDEDSASRIKFELKNRPESFEDKTCFPLEDYLHKIHTSPMEVQAKAEEILAKVYEDMTTAEEEKIAEAA